MIRLENDLFRLETLGIRHFASGIQGHSEAVVVRAVPLSFVMPIS